MLSRRPGCHLGARSSWRLRRLTLILTVGLVFSATAVAAPTDAVASPEDDLAAKKANAAQIEAQLEEHHMRAQVLNEEYLQAQAAAEEAAANIAGAEQGIALAEATSENLRARLRARAAQLYISAGSGDPIGLDATDVREMAARAKYSEAAADLDNRILGDLTLANEALEDQRELAEKAKKDAEARQGEADEALQAVQSAVADEEQMLASIEGEIRDLVDEIAAEKRRADEARAREAFEALQSQARSQRTSGEATGRDPVSVGVTPFDVPAPSGGAETAVAYAWAQLGKPYRYAGVGPDAYDCSGLTMMAWAQAGVSMPHGSIAQGEMFPRVPDSEMAPGDLVIYYPDHHHVGMYVGNGQTISATQTGDFIKLQPVFRSGFQFAVRPG